MYNDGIGTTCAVCTYMYMCIVYAHIVPWFKKLQFNGV